MGILHRKFSGISGIDFSGMSEEELESLLKEILEDGIHGISFSAYLEGQSPGSQLSRKQIIDRMKILQPHVKWVRSFSCVDGNELIPQIAHEFGIKTLVGAWIGDDPEKNEEEIEAVIEVGKSGYADIIAIGNEVMLRGEMSEDDIINLIKRVKTALPDIPVGYVDAYYVFASNPRLSDECDVIMTNCYPFWEGYSFEHSLAYMKNMYQIAKSAAKGKKVIISETGWPNLGSAERQAIPSYENAIKYFINTYNWAEQDNIEIFYFSSFDETWKIGAEGDVGAYWGLWDKNGLPKFGQA
jgi:glucan 1,3-beta-glucosidase